MFLKFELVSPIKMIKQGLTIQIFETFKTFKTQGTNLKPKINIRGQIHAYQFLRRVNIVSCMFEFFYVNFQTIYFLKPSTI
jgi:hypothetical protein